MNSAIERLLSLRVGDIMKENVVPVEEYRTMAEAAAILQQHKITGAPVVDAAGKCVGVISNTDFVLREHCATDDQEHIHGGWQHRVTADDDLPGVMIEAFSEDRVREHMSSLLQAASLTTSLINASRMMCNEHIHRLVVIDECNRPVGVVSSLDVIAALVGAIEE